MSEIVLKVGKRGEIYTSKEIREKTGIREGGKVRAVVKGKKLIIEALPSIEETISNCLMEITPEEAEKLSEEAQKEGGIYG